MNNIAVIIHFVVTSFSIIPAQCRYTSTLSQIVSLSFGTGNVNTSAPSTQPDEVLKIVSQRQDGNTVSALTNSPLSTTDVFASYSSSDQKAFRSISPTEKLQSNATANYTQSGIPAKSSTPTMLPITPSIPAVNQTPTAIIPRTEPTKGTSQDEGIIITRSSGTPVAIIIVATVIIIIVIVVIAIFIKKGKRASYHTESNHEAAVPMNEVGTVTPKT